MTTLTPLPARSAGQRLYGMQERADHLDFDVRLQGARDVLARPHRHEYFQIQVGLAGGTQQFIGGAVRPFGTGYLSFVLPYRTHMVVHPPGAQYAIVNFDQRFLWPDLDLDAADLDAAAAERLPTLAPFVFQEQLDFHFAPPEFARVRAWIDELIALNAQPRYGSGDAIRGILLQWLGWVCRQHATALQQQARQQADHGAARHDALQRVLRYVREHLHEELTLQGAAEAALLSPNYLAHLLKKRTQRSFTELVNERRLEVAKELLLNSPARIADVAHRCGFGDESYFARRFKRHTGLTPRAFREAGRPQPAGADVAE